jgi:membrane-associated phospholipid phosphatase
MWIPFPNWRILYAVTIIAVNAGFVVLDLHFLSDVVAGSFFGSSTAPFTIAMWKAIELMSNSQSSV